MEMNNHYVGLPRLFSRFTEIRYINGWIIFSVDLVISLCVSLIGVYNRQNEKYEFPKRKVQKETFELHLKSI